MELQHGRVMLAAELPAISGSEAVVSCSRCTGYLTRESNSARVAPNLQILLTQIEMLADAFLDEVDGHAFFLRSDDVTEDLLRRRQGNLPRRSGRHTPFKRVNAPSNSRTLDLIARAMYSATSSGKTKPVVLGFFLQNRNLCLEIRRAGCSAIKPHSKRERSRSSIEIDVFGQAVGRN